ncbi:MAG: aspartyl protease family protein [Planctomycetota bacterium]|nr:aspartyl protease family protein [Planctomycetota bacterium]
MRWPRYALLTLWCVLLSVRGGQCGQGAQDAPPGPPVKIDDLPKGVVAVPMTVLADRIFIPVTLNSSMACTCLIDTGSDLTILNRGRLDLKDLRPVTTETLQGTFVGKLDVQHVVLPALAIGEYAASNIRVGVVSHKPGQALERIDMLLGMDVLSRSRFTFDFAHKRFLLWPARTVLPPPAANVERAQLPLQRASDSMSQQRIEGKINGTLRVSFILDSGAEGPTFVAMQKPQEYGLVLDAEKTGFARVNDGSMSRQVDFFRATFPKLELGAMVFQNVRGKVMDASQVSSPAARQDLSRTFSILGTPFLKTLDAVHFDVPNRAVYFERAKAGTERKP